MATLWKVQVEQSRTPDGVMVPAHTRYRETRIIELPSMISMHDAKVRIPPMLQLPKRMRIVNAHPWKEVPR